MYNRLRDVVCSAHTESPYLMLFSAVLYWFHVVWGTFSFCLAYFSLAVLITVTHLPLEKMCVQSFDENEWGHFIFLLSDFVCLIGSCIDSCPTSNKTLIASFAPHIPFWFHRYLLFQPWNHVFSQITLLLHPSILTTSSVIPSFSFFLPRNLFLFHLIKNGFSPHTIYSDYSFPPPNSSPFLPFHLGPHPFSL